MKQNKPECVIATQYLLERLSIAITKQLREFSGSFTEGEQKAIVFSACLEMVLLVAADISLSTERVMEAIKHRVESIKK
jgi:hypothetical protein